MMHQDICFEISSQGGNEYLSGEKPGKPQNNEIHYIHSPAWLPSGRVYLNHL